ncbi:MAG: hypothetical protein ACFB2Z_06360 [Maricaulaceae bacterium]
MTAGDDAPARQKSASSLEAAAARTAVVFIHGQGEQRPGEALRELVRTVWQTDVSVAGDPDVNTGAARVWSTPDEVGGTYETVRLATSASADGRRFDFYEFYWAHLMHGSRFGHVWRWLDGLMGRDTAEVPQELKPARRFIVWFCAQLFFVILAAGLVFGQFIGFESWLYINIFIAIALSLSGLIILTGKPLKAIQFLFFALPVFLGLFYLGQGDFQPARTPLTDPNRAWVISFYVFFLIYGLGVNWLIRTLSNPIAQVMGDSARYLTPAPSNIARRQDIRAAGVGLLKALHGLKAGPSSDAPKYDRIVIIAHSLGTVVGYDVLKALWAETVDDLTDAPGDAEHPIRQAVQACEAAAQRLHDPQCRLDEQGQATILRKLAGAETPEIKRAQPVQNEAFEALEGFLTAQADFRRALAAKGWRITDFITLGSPLTYGPLLLAPSNARFEEMVADRELPQSPPVLQSETHQNNPCFHYMRNRDGEPVLQPNHASLFAAIRWTNMFFPARPVAGAWLFDKGLKWGDWVRPTRWGRLVVTGLARTSILGPLLRLPARGDVVGGPLASHFGPGVLDLNLDAYDRLVREPGVARGARPQQPDYTRADAKDRAFLHNDYWIAPGLSDADLRTSAKLPPHLHALRAAVRLSDDPYASKAF